MLNFLWGTEREPAQVALYSRQGTGIRSDWFELDKPDVEEAFRKHAEQVSQGTDVWYSVCARRPGEYGPWKRGGEADVIGMPGVWVDIDVVSPHHKATDLPTEAEVAGAISRFDPPSLVVMTGGGLHAYWVFEEPWWFTDYRAARKLSERFRLLFGERSGVRVDPVQDLARMLRYPGTFNFKSDPPKPVRSAVTGPKYPRRVIEHWTNTTMQIAVVSDIEPVSESASESSSFLADIGAPDAKPAQEKPKGKPFDRDAVIESLSQNTKNAQLVNRLLSGKALAEAGSRDTTLNRVANLLAFTAIKHLGMEATVADLMSFIMPSLTRMASEGGEDNPPPTTEQVAKKVARAIKKAQLASKEENKKLADIMAGLEAAREAKGGEWSDDQIAKFASEQKTTLDEWAHRWVIAYRGHYYTWMGDKGYRTIPWDRNDLLLSLRQDLAQAPIEWLRVNSNGAVVEKKAIDIVQQYGTTVDTVRYTYVGESRLEGTTFHLRAAKEAPHPSVFDTRVDQWLRLLAGSALDYLLDWLAVVGDLTRPNCALYLEGPAGCGKSMLAHGIASLWGSTPMPMSDLNKFNYHLLECPLVFADEVMPGDKHEGEFAGVVRDRIAARAHHIDGKFMPKASIDGCIRMMLCANNDRMLSGIMTKLSRDDVDAIAQRFLHVRASDDAARYLSDLGGREGTADWVEGGRIARHLVWLRHSRSVASGGRFASRTPMTGFHDRLMTAGGLPALVATFVVRDLRRKGGPKHVNCKDGHILVNGTRVYEQWDDLMKERVPSSHQIADVLKRWSNPVEPKVKIKRNNESLWYWRIEERYIRAFAVDVEGDLELDALAGGV